MLFVEFSIPKFYSPQISNDTDLLAALDSYFQDEEQVAISPLVPEYVSI